MLPNTLWAFCRDVGTDGLDLIDKHGVMYRLPMQYTDGIKLEFFAHYVRFRWIDVDFATGFMGVEPLYGIGPVITLSIVWHEERGYFRILAFPWGDSAEQGR